jgi:hypothetical protein
MADDAELLKKFLAPIVVCKRYKPKFGQGNVELGLSLDQFHTLYGADPFYAWIGLDSPLMYAAHKAAGGMTSVYRQIGKGCEYLFREIIIDATGYRDRRTAEWSYSAKTQAGGDKTLSLDGRLEIAAIEKKPTRERVEKWIRDYCRFIKAEPPKKGAVFEVRQGYKSKDSKRQNADIDNIAVAWAQGYMPVFAIFSGQIDGDLVLRYRNSRGGIIVGLVNNNPLESLFAFSQQVLEFDLAGFFKRNSKTIKLEIAETLKLLLTPE